MTEFSHPIAVGDIERRARSTHLQASAEQCAALAKRLGVESLRDLAADLTVHRRHGVINVTGRFAGYVTQTCVVTLEPFEAEVQGEIEERFTDAPQVGSEIDVDLDTPEPLEGDELDLGELVAQSLALEIDPHPRSDTADLSELDAEAELAKDPAHPFAALARLKPAP